VKLVHLVGFIIKKFVKMHGHTDVKSVSCFASKWTLRISRAMLMHTKVSVMVFT